MYPVRAVCNNYEKLLFLFVIISYRLHEHNIRTDVLCDLFDLKLPEMGGLDLHLATGDCNDAVLGRLYPLSNFLALAHIDLHGLYLHAITGPSVNNLILNDIMALVYQLVYMDL